MSTDIYQQDIKALAASAIGEDEISPEEKMSSHCVTIDNPLCGDRVTLVICLDKTSLDAEKISSLKYEVKGCLLCRAAASVIGESAPGMTKDEFEAIFSSLSAALKSGEQFHDHLSGSWKNLELFQPVSSHKSRHACVLLPFKALSQALQNN